jgi:hypothetical protein
MEVFQLISIITTTTTTTTNTNSGGGSGSSKILRNYVSGFSVQYANDFFGGVYIQEVFLFYGVVKVQCVCNIFTFLEYF